MIKMGLPKEVVKHAMTRDELDPRYVCLFSFAICSATFYYYLEALFLIFYLLMNTIIPET